MRNPKSTPLQRLQAAAERIRAQFESAMDNLDDASMQNAQDAADALGLEIRVNRHTGEVEVARPPRETE